LSSVLVTAGLRFFKFLYVVHTRPSRYQHTFTIRALPLYNHNQNARTSNKENEEFHKPILHSSPFFVPMRFSSPIDRFQYSHKITIFGSSKCYGNKSIMGMTTSTLWLLLFLSSSQMSTQAILIAPLMEDNTKISTTVLGIPNVAMSWYDSYSVGKSCYCESTFDHGIGSIQVKTPLPNSPNMTVRQVCDLLGPGPGSTNRPKYNDIQCGNGPPYNSTPTRASDEIPCPGRTEYGQTGCIYIGPKWNFQPFLPPVSGPKRAPAVVPTPVSARVPTPSRPVSVPAPVRVPVVSAPVPRPVSVPVPPLSKPTVPLSRGTSSSDVAYFQWWNADANTYLQKLNQGDKFCQTTYQLGIEVIAANSPQSITIILNGPLNTTINERNPPYMSFGNSGTDMFGRVFAIGNYTITAYPNDNVNQGALTNTFQVINCSK
jgi:hypothetical protein